MAITPKVASQLDPDDDAEIKAREVRIDQAIRERVRRGMAIWIDASLFGPYGAIRDALVSKYERAGWSVTHYDDQRDGASFVLKAR